MTEPFDSAEREIAEVIHKYGITLCQMDIVFRMVKMQAETYTVPCSPSKWESASLASATRMSEGTEEKG